jgi:hypothetical protein
MFTKVFVSMIEPQSSNAQLWDTGQPWSPTRAKTDSFQFGDLPTALE